MHILWINELASFKGGCEHYIFNTVNFLKSYHVSSSLLYNPINETDIHFLNAFNQAFPLVDLERQLAELSFDVVYVHQLFDNEDFKVLHNINEPVIRFYHDSWLFCLRRHKFNDVGFLASTFGMAINRSRNRLGFEINTLTKLTHAQDLNKQLDGFIVGSSFMANILAEAGFDKAKILKIPLYTPDIPAENTPLQREKKLLLFVGQLVRGKGLDILIKALKYLEPDFKLIIAGKGRQEQEYKNLANKLGLQKQITFAGYLEDSEVNELYQRAMCVVIPSRYPETFGFIGLEAMRFGTPIVASNLGGMVEWLIDGITGIAVPPNDPKAIAEAILKIYHHPDIAASLEKNGIKTYQEKFKPQFHIKTLIKFFQSKIEEKYSKIVCNRGNFTLFGSEGLEKKISALMLEISKAILKFISYKDIYAFLLIGGYGKGEGGVEWKNGEEYPHNNFDFLLITTSSFRKNKNGKYALDKILKTIGEKYKIGLDLGIISAKQLKNATSTIMWYEMYHGHKLLLGNTHFVTSLPFKDLNRIPSEDFLNLMVNRGTLLIINDWLLDHKESNQESNPIFYKILVKHAIKAIIGFGDALLYFKGLYHWSYKEKRFRMQQCQEVSDSFRDLYEKAASFRFQPNYESYSNIDVISWLEKIRQALCSVYLECEAIRLNLLPENFSWEQYFEAFLKSSLSECFSMHGATKKIKGLVTSPRSLMGKSAKQKLAFLLLSPSQKLAFIFPIIAFKVGDDMLKNDVKKFLNAQSVKASDLRDAYLKYWGHYNDPNFSPSSLLKTVGIDL